MLQARFGPAGTTAVREAVLTRLRNLRDLRMILVNTRRRPAERSRPALGGKSPARLRLAAKQCAQRLLGHEDARSRARPRTSTNPLFQWRRNVVAYPTTGPSFTNLRTSLLTSGVSS